MKSLRHWGAWSPHPWGARDVRPMPPPPTPQSNYFFIFMQFSVMPNNRLGWLPPPQEILHPPLISDQQSHNILIQWYNILKNAVTTTEQNTTQVLKNNKAGGKFSSHLGFAIFHLFSCTLASDGSRISLRWGTNPRGGANIPNFPKNCMKLKEFGPQGGAHPSSSLDPPLLACSPSFPQVSHR